MVDLADRAGVSPRTVRYYIAEGLLPPPLGAGPTSAYGNAHLDRLRLIGRYKAAYLPLKEIRRRLAGLDDAAVRSLLDAVEGPEPVAADPLDDAAAYLDRVLGAPLPTRAAIASSPPRRGSPVASMAMEASAPALPEVELGAPAPGEGRPDDGVWRRVPLGDDAELLVREDAYRRRRDHVEWLVAWARRVFR